MPKYGPSMSVFACKVLPCNHYEDAGLQERLKFKDGEGEGKLDSVRLASFCIQIWMYNDVHES